MTMDLHKKKKKKKKNQEPKKWSLEKKACFCQNKRQIVLLFYPFCLNQGRKDDSAVMFSRSPYVSELTPSSFVSLLSQIYPPLT